MPTAPRRAVLAAMSAAAIAGALARHGAAARAATPEGPDAGAIYQTPQTGRPVVLELFTSQGCSSCPPADALLSELAATRADILPLGFHITYWDGMGWRDPFSLAAATERQRAYARLLGSTSIYTPQLIVDGRADVVGSDRQGVLAAITAAAEDARVTAPLRVTLAADAITVDIGAGQAPDGGAAEVLLVGYDPGHRTRVARGENGGRDLVESNVVRALIRLGGWTGAAARYRVAPPPGARIAVIVQGPDGRILGAMPDAAAAARG